MPAIRTAETNDTFWRTIGVEWVRFCSFAIIVDIAHGNLASSSNSFLDLNFWEMRPTFTVCNPDAKS
jgi:hypothetical protein